MAMLDELADYLEGFGVGSQAGPAPTLYKGSRPDDPDDVFVIYTYPGNAPEYVQESFTPTWERPQIQGLARSKSYEDAERRARLAWSILSSVTNATLGGTRYRSIRPNGSPALIGRDASDRVLVAFNATVEREAEIVLTS